MYIYIRGIEGANNIYPVVQEWLYCKKMEGKKQFLSAITVKTLEQLGKIKKCNCEDVDIHPW